MPTQQALQLLDRYNRAIARLEDATTQRLHDAMDRSYRQLERDLRTSYSNISRNDTLLASQRKVLILEQLGETLQVVRPDQAAEYQRSLQTALQTANQTGRTLADELAQAVDSTTAVGALSNIPIEAVALQARDGLERLKRHSADFRQKTSAIVEQGLIQGWGPAKVADLLRSELAVTKSKAETLARTEILSALNDSAQQRYKDNGIEAVQVICTIGDVCPYCAARNTQVYPVGKIRVPFHPRCRCILLPYRPAWQEKGLTDDEFLQRYRGDRLRDLEAAGGKPNNGVTPFEKAAGLTTPPKPLQGGAVAQARQSPPLPVATRKVLQFEDEKRLQPYETALALDRRGKVLLQKDGTETGVSYTAQELSLFKGAILTHNHPPINAQDQLGVGLSVADIRFAVWHELSEIRAVSKGYRYSLKPGGAEWTPQYWQETAKAVYEKHEEDVYQEIKSTRSQRKAAGATDDEIYLQDNQYYFHEVARRTAKELGWQYQRETWQKFQPEFQPD